MNTPLIRTLLYSVLISIFVTTLFFLLGKDMPETEKQKTSAPKQQYQADFTIQASRTSLTEQQGAFTQAVAQNFRITGERLNAAGFGHNMKMQNDSTYTVTVKAVEDVHALSDLVTINGRMALYEVYQINEVYPALQTFVREWEPVMKKILPDSILKKPGNDFSKNKSFVNVITLPQPVEDETGRTVYHPYIATCKLADSGLVRAYINTQEVMAKFPADTRLMFSEPELRPKETDSIIYLYAIRYHPDPLSNKSIVEAKAEISYDKDPVIDIKYNAAGAARWERMTEQNVGKPIAMCINDRVTAAPLVMQKIYGGQSRIWSRTSFDDCRAMAVLLTGEDLLLPVRITQTSINTVTQDQTAPRSPHWKLVYAFIAAFAISFSIIWFVFKPGKKAPGNP